MTVCKKCGMVTDNKSDLCYSCFGDFFIKVGSSSNDFRIDKPIISSNHMVVIMRQEGFFAVDLESTNGTYISGIKIEPFSEIIIRSGKKISLGSHNVEFDDIMRSFEIKYKNQPDFLSIFENAKLKTQFPDFITIGRHTDCDIILSEPVISSRHASIRKINNSLFEVTDLNSTNGVFINNVLIKNGYLKPGDKLFFGSIEILWENIWTGKNIKRESIYLNANNIDLDIYKKETKKMARIVNNVNVVLKAGEFVAVMGPSGSGKTTLFEILNGYKKPTSGNVYLNDFDIYENWDRLKESIGYVPQDDIIYPDLKVYESLYYTAKLRLPSDTSDAEIKNIIETTLKDLELSDKINDIIGGPEGRTLSGGQRKRVNIAQELLTKPPILFLDEPTSGLSAQDAFGVIKVLRKIADSGRLVICSIHSPTEKIFNQFDNILLLKQGYLSYFGSTDLCFDFFKSTLNDPTELMYVLDEKPGQDWNRKYLGSPIFKEFVEERKQNLPAFSDFQIESSMPLSRQIRQFMTLSDRYIKRKMRSNLFLLLLALQSIVISLLVASVFSGAEKEVMMRSMPLFIMVVAIIFFGCFNASQEIVSEKVIFRRERKVNLQIWPYIVSKFIWLIFFGVMQVIVFTGILFIILKFDSKFLFIVGLLSLLMAASIALGLLISSLSPNSVVAMTLVPVILIPQIILGGTLVKLDFWRGSVAKFTVSRWASEALLDSEATLLKKKPIKIKEVACICNPKIKIKPDPVKIWINNYNLKQNNRRTDFVLLILHTLTYLFLAGIFISVRK
ncbi:ATP-binding cassette domain-containing protein [Myxococcota bacterium]|nr:ATP-binding cassette domain-containing protein [Myxococcota bacterium]MBU1381991.1 ATP-binding cassette domain-containing protein [Myxococcota bacterium]MBU1496778.1 ATP-binding cassette domain-containing protein [Myxococcota bacterium]